MLVVGCINNLNDAKEIEEIAKTFIIRNRIIELEK